MRVIFRREFKGMNILVDKARCVSWNAGGIDTRPGYIFRNARSTSKLGQLVPSIIFMKASVPETSL